MEFISPIIVGNYDFLGIVFQPAPVTIKDMFCKALSLFSMAGLSPTSVDEYCKTFDVSFFNVKIPCLFCNFDLSLVDLAGFVNKVLSLVWRGNKCFACCIKCLKLSAKFERENFMRCTVSGEALEYLLKEPLSQIIIRCLYCYKRLDFIEKIDCCYAELPFCLIRCHWRNCCRHCRFENERSRT